jgi:DNA-binding response OmpR family regulator
MSHALKVEVIPLAEVPVTDSISDVEKNRPVVLVVDDERVIADTLAIILSRSGFAAMTAYDGASALEMAGVVPPELLLSDVMMGPGIDGTELAITLIKLFPDCKVLLFSGHAATSDLLDKAREGGHNFTLLTKPLHPADLLARITDAFKAQEPGEAVVA